MFHDTKLHQTFYDTKLCEESTAFEAQYLCAFQNLCVPGTLPNPPVPTEWMEETCYDGSKAMALGAACSACSLACSEELISCRPPVPLCIDTT